MNKLALVPLVDRMGEIMPAVMYESEAAKYVMLGVHEFRKLVDAGTIPFRRHAGRKRRIYLKADPDEYLSRLPRGTMSDIEGSHGPSDKGA